MAEASAAGRAGRPKADRLDRPEIPGPTGTETLVPDTSVLVDGRITDLIHSGDYPSARILVPLAALAELESQANRSQETGFAGLDELRNLHRLAAEGTITVEFVGRRPNADELQHAEAGAVDALIRDTAVASGGTLVTSDRVQAYAASAQGIRHHYLRPLTDDKPDLTRLAVWKFFDAETLSVHLKDDCVPMVKRGRPGLVRYEPIGTSPMKHTEIRALARECIEFAKRDYTSFLEMDKPGCTVVQLGPMRITIAQPPFSDGLEVTAVRPTTTKTLDDYDVPPDILDRLQGRSRGVFVSGPPGSGKSTFAAAVAEHLHSLGRVVKTMEQPRDLQVRKEITQYGALNRDMQWTGDVLLLVRPDHVIYDEVRTTDDFKVFADMRLAGVGLIGVTHANRAIDAVQRLLGRVDLGMIPQIVDTVLFIDAGRLDSILELFFTVRVPAGMTDADLARPVVVVRDVLSRRELYELYTYGEQVVVMPLDAVGGGRGRFAGRGGAGGGRFGGRGGGGRHGGRGRGRGPNAGFGDDEADEGPGQGPSSGMLERELSRIVQRFARGEHEVKVSGSRATIYVEDNEIPLVVGKGGRTVIDLERKFGLSIDVKSMHERAGRRQAAQTAAAIADEAASGTPPETFGDVGAEPAGGGVGSRQGGRGARDGRGLVPRVKKTTNNVFLVLDSRDGGRSYRVQVEDAIVGEATASDEGKLRFKTGSPEGQTLLRAYATGLDIRCMPLE